jgi:hypothetical protein
MKGKFSINQDLFILYIIGLLFLIWRTHDITNITLQKNDFSYHSDFHLFLLFFGSLFVFIYATYHKIWPLSILTLVSIYQAIIFYYKIHYELNGKISLF